MKEVSVIKRYLVPALLILIGSVFVIIGVKDGEAGAVIRKAVAICMECIGLG